MNLHFFTAPFVGSGVARGAWCPLAANESSARQLGVLARRIKIKSASYIFAAKPPPQP